MILVTFPTWNCLLGMLLGMFTYHFVGVRLFPYCHVLDLFCGRYSGPINIDHLPGARQLLGDSSRFVDLMSFSPGLKWTFIGNCAAGSLHVDLSKRTVHVSALESLRLC